LRYAWSHSIAFGILIDDPGDRVLLARKARWPVGDIQAPLVIVHMERSRDKVVGGMVDTGQPF
jgi:hypothetical protein